MEEPLTDTQWGILQNYGHVAKYKRGALTIEGLVETAKQLRKAFGPTTSARETVRLIDKSGRDYGGGATPERGRAISEFLAGEARKEAALIDFRKSTLGGRLLKLKEVETWISERAEQEGQPTRFVAVPLPEGCEVRFCDDGSVYPSPAVKVSARHPALPGSPNMLEYGVAADSWAHLIPVRQGGVLDRLRIVSQGLSAAYGWQPAQAAVFVLTDLIPVVRQVDVTLHLKSLAVLNRIHMAIDPALSPREVAAAYRKARNQALGERGRQVTEKRMKLALFRASRPAGETYAKAMQAWNRKFPGLRYEHVSNFGRDCKQAIAKVFRSLNMRGQQ